MTISDLYGFYAPGIEAHRIALNQFLNSEMEDRYSSFVSGKRYYRLILPDGVKLRLQENYDVEDCEWAEDQFKTVPILLFAEGDDRVDDFRRALKRSNIGIQFLRRETSSPTQGYKIIINNNLDI